MKNPNHQLQYKCLGFHGDNPDRHNDMVTEKYRCVLGVWWKDPSRLHHQPGLPKVGGANQVKSKSAYENSVRTLFSLGTAVMWSMSSFHLHFYFLDVAIFLVFTFTFLNQMWLFSCIHFSF